MKRIILAVMTTIALSGCVVNIVNEPVQNHPVQVCRWVDIPVYGYADVYRSHEATVRIQQTAYVDRQWRCN